MLLISIFLEYGFHDVSKKYRQSCAFFLLSNDFFFLLFLCVWNYCIKPFIIRYRKEKSMVFGRLEDL